jgi:acetyl-CoA C-acetyltransferase
MNKVCGSGLKAVISAAQAIALGDADVVVAGGMESMSNVPYYDRSARTGARMGNVELVDGMIHDGLWDVYGQQHMGMCAEHCATTQGISRAAQDEYALESTRRAIQAARSGAFKAEIVPVELEGKKGEKTVVAEDEGPMLAKPDKIPSLKPVFKRDGTVTAANASSINDGGAALVLMSAERAQREGRTVLARIGAYGGAARAPVEFTIAPADAVRKTLAKARLEPKDVDLWEINEAFAVVSIANNRLIGLDGKNVNVRGGAVVLGHPIGASGARLLVTLLYAMKDLGKRRGLASLCIGGGEAVALIVER